jgi:hypothetical protein
MELHKSPPLETLLEKPLSREKLKYNSLFPKTLILFITTHGEICVKDDKAAVFDIPESIHNVFKLNLAPPGVSASMSVLDMRVIPFATKYPDFGKTFKSIEKSTSLENIRAIIKYQLSLSKHVLPLRYLSETSDTSYLHKFMGGLQSNIRRFYVPRMLMDSEESSEERDTLPEAVNLHMWLESPVSINSENQFLHVFPPPNKKTMIDKLYFTEDPRTEHSATPFTGIIALNLSRGWKNILPDILSSMGFPSRSTQDSLFLRTSQIFDFLSNIKDSEGKPIVENVLIIDTSCANFQDKNPKNKPFLKSVSIETGHGGKRTKRRRKKSKSIRKKSKSIKKKSKSIKKKSKRRD